MRPLRMVPMTSLPPFQARLLAARLGAEGILWQLRGESAVYPIAAIEVLVEADEVERARALLEGDPLGGPCAPEAGPDPDGIPSTPASIGASRSRSAHAVLVWVVVAVVLLALALRISHIG